MDARGGRRLGRYDPRGRRRFRAHRGELSPAVHALKVNVLEDNSRINRGDCNIARSRDQRDTRWEDEHDLPRCQSCARSPKERRARRVRRFAAWKAKERPHSCAISAGGRDYDGRRRCIKRPRIGANGRRFSQAIQERNDGAGAADKGALRLYGLRFEVTRRQSRMTRSRSSTTSQRRSRTSPNGVENCRPYRRNGRSSATQRDLSLERANAIKAALVKTWHRRAKAGHGRRRRSAARRPQRYASGTCSEPPGRAHQIHGLGRGQATSQGDVGLSCLTDVNVVRLRRHARGRDE